MVKCALICRAAAGACASLVPTAAAVFCSLHLTSGLRGGRAATDSLSRGTQASPPIYRKNPTLVTLPRRSRLDDAVPLTQQEFRMGLGVRFYLFTTIDRMVVQPHRDSLDQIINFKAQTVSACRQDRLGLDRQRDSTALQRERPARVLPERPCRRCRQRRPHCRGPQYPPHPPGSWLRELLCLFLVQLSRVLLCPAALSSAS
jgi:hypothetical protein